MTLKNRFLVEFEYQGGKIASAESVSNAIARYFPTVADLKVNPLFPGEVIGNLADFTKAAEDCAARELQDWTDLENDYVARQIDLVRALEEAVGRLSELQVASQSKRMKKFINRLKSKL